MPLMGYKKCFAPLVERGDKRQSIRAYRKDGKNPKPGQKLYHYIGLRTPSCRKILESVCRGVEPIAIESWGNVVVGTKTLSVSEEEALARADGFESARAFFDFFEKVYSLPFYGLLIRW